MEGELHHGDRARGMDVDGEVLRIGLRIPFEHFPELARQHEENVPDTVDIEREAEELIQGGFSPAAACAFVRRVCDWGKGPRVRGQVEKRNADTDIRNALSTAWDYLNEESLDVQQAVSAVRGVNGLGLSFGSKHLRFLAPHLCPVFDRLLQAALPYSWGSRGYAGFAHDCQRLARVLTARQLDNPWRSNNEWRAADAEAAIYRWVRGEGAD